MNDDLANRAATVIVNQITGADLLLLRRSTVASTAVESVEEAPTARRKGKGKEPDLVVEGDMLINTPKMVGLVHLSLLLLAVYFVQVRMRPLPNRCYNCSILGEKTVETNPHVTAAVSSVITVPVSVRRI